MNLNCEEYLYKYDFDESKNLKLCSTNGLYSPKISSDKQILCMDWNQNFFYHKKPCDQKIIDYFFNREAATLNIFQNKSWCPKILEIDYTKKKIFIKYNGMSLNHLLFKEKNLDFIFKNWKEQLRLIVKDIEDSGFYKIALYPHCFYLDIENNIKTIDYYSCISKQEESLPLEMVGPIIGRNSIERFKYATKADRIYARPLYEYTIQHHLNNVWPLNPFLD